MAPWVLTSPLMLTLPPAAILTGALYAVIAPVVTGPREVIVTVPDPAPLPAVTIWPPTATAPPLSISDPAGLDGPACPVRSIAESIVSVL